MSIRVQLCIQVVDGYLMRSLNNILYLFPSAKYIYFQIKLEAACNLHIENNIQHVCASEEALENTEFYL